MGVKILTTIRIAKTEKAFNENILKFNGSLLSIISTSLENLENNEI
jgi:hypothetical protein